MCEKFETICFGGKSSNFIYMISEAHGLLHACVVFIDLHLYSRKIIDAFSISFLLLLSFLKLPLLLFSS